MNEFIALEAQILFETRNVCIIFRRLVKMLERSGERHTQVGLINVLHPISYHSIRDDKKIKLNNKLAFLRCICIRIPLDMIPLLLFGDRHCDGCADEGSCRIVGTMGRGFKAYANASKDPKIGISRD